MTTNHQWLYAGTEPLLSDMLSDPATRDLMRADGVSVEDVNAVVDRVRRSIRPLAFAPPPRVGAGAPSARASKFVRVRPFDDDHEAANLQAAAGVISRWIAALSNEKPSSLD
jgi:hypothetical protein